MNAPDHHAGVVLAQQSLRSNEVERASLRVALLTGGDDRSYALGLATSLMGHGVHIDFIGSDQVDGPELHGTPSVRFLNLRGDQSPGANLARKLWRLLRYYARLVAYAARSQATVFHILWNNKFLHFDRTLLMLYYRALGHRVVMTAHNVNAAKRDGRDSWLNRLTLRIQYHLCNQIFVHTSLMGQELASDRCGGRDTPLCGVKEVRVDLAVDGHRIGLSPQTEKIVRIGQRRGLSCRRQQDD